MLTLCGFVSIVDEWYMMKFMDDTCWIGIWYHNSACIWHRETGVWFYAPFLRQCRECWNRAYILMLTCVSRQLHFSMAHVHVEIDESPWHYLFYFTSEHFATRHVHTCCRVLQDAAKVPNCLFSGSVVKPLWSMIRAWMTEGELQDDTQMFDSYWICCSLPWCWRPLEAIKKPWKPRVQCVFVLS